MFRLRCQQDWNYVFCLNNVLPYFVNSRFTHCVHFRAVFPLFFTVGEGVGNLQIKTTGGNFSGDVTVFGVIL